MRRLEECVDKNTSAAVLSLLASNWLAIRLDLLGSAISFFIVCLAVGSPGFIPAEYVAIGLSSSFQVGFASSSPTYRFLRVLTFCIVGHHVSQILRSNVGTM